MQHPDKTDLKPSLNSIVELIKSEAELAKLNPSEILTLLRILEDLHRDIRENYFLNSLPSNRQLFYAILKEIEQNGGWPYIPRMKIREFLKRPELIFNSWVRVVSVPTS